MTVLITNVWIGVPFFTVLLFSALQDVPPELKEAAMIDGGNPWQVLVRITLPVIRPVIEVVFVLGFVFTVKVFDVVISLTEGGPANSTQLIATWAYNLSFQQFDYGAGAALNTVLLVIALLVAPVYIRLNRDSLQAGHDMGRQRKLTPLFAGVAALVALVILLFPLYAVIVGSFENNNQLLGTHYNFFPPTPTLANYRTVLSTQGAHIVSSLIIGVATALLTLAISLPAAHALARYRFRVTVGVVASLLVAQILPSIVIANSLFVVYHKLHLLNSYPGLILADASYAVPFSILVLRAFMLGLPVDVLQAARVDGANEWRTFTRVVLPMSRSAIITVALFAFLNGWGDFIFALTLLNGSTIEPITLSIYNYIGVYSENLGASMALAVFAILPAAMMLIAAQRYIAAGLTVGSVKG